MNAGALRDPGPRASRAKGGLELRLLGALEVRERASGELLPLANAKTRALLAILACERGRVFSQEELVERLWGEELSAGRTTPERARANLRGRIAELRHLHPALAEGITTHPAAEPGPGGYCLERSSRIQVDLEELTRHLSRGQDLRQRGELAQALPSLEKAAQLWRGDFLQEEPYAEWAAELRGIWRERHLENLTRLAEQVRHHSLDRGPYPPPSSPGAEAEAEVGEEERCYQRLREARWGWGSEPRPICPYCRSSRVHGHGRLPGSPERRYCCLECGVTFTDRTGTVFAHRNLPLTKLFQALKLLARGLP